MCEEAMNILEHVSFAIGIVAIAIIVWGVLLGLFEVLKSEFYRFKPKGKKSLNLYQIRHIVGSYLLLGLEFLIAADVIRTIVKPTLEELAILGGIVAIRTVISYFLGKELGDEGKYPFSAKRKKQQR